jgi:hypothetical protein
MPRMTDAEPLTTAAGKPYIPSDSATGFSPR